MHHYVNYMVQSDMKSEKPKARTYNPKALYEMGTNKLRHVGLDCFVSCIRNAGPTPSHRRRSRIPLKPSTVPCGRARRGCPAASSTRARHRSWFSKCLAVNKICIDVSTEVCVFILQNKRHMMCRCKHTTMRRIRDETRLGKC